MQHHYISLGSACNAATMMKVAGLRRASYPFDWLLNVEDGLSAVTKILREDFANVSDPDGYVYTDYAPVGHSVPAYKMYPKTFHVHSDPAADPKSHADMVRRFARMRETLRSNDIIHFVYYKDVSFCREVNPETDAATVLKLMVQEAKDFLNFIDETRSQKTTMLLVLEGSVEDEIATQQAVRDATSPDNRIAFGHSLKRYDDDATLNKRWQRDWIDLIVNRTQMPLWMRARCHTKQLVRRARETLRTAKG